METIKEAFESVSAIAGRQKYLENENYRKSAFCVDIKTDDGILLYQSLTGKIVLLENEGTDYLENKLIRKELVENWFLVTENFDELKHCDQIRSVLKMLAPENKSISYYTVFTTTACNARCFYCFELGQKKITMSTQTAHDTAQWISKHANNTKITFRWFGGEPLFNSKAIDIICNDLKEKKAEFASSIVSNAYLFDEEMVNKARESWNLKHAIITIDGTEEVYNRTKAFIYKDTNAYKKVMDNIERLLKSHIAVTVNLNMDSANAEDLKELSHELGKRFSAYSSFKARCGLLKEYIGKIHRFDNDEQALNKRNEINAILNKYGIREKKYLSNLPKLNSCMADDPGAVTILADGRIGKCEHYGDSQEVGNIYCDKINEEKASSWKKTWPPIKECRTCVYYPWCFRLERCNGFVSECNQLQRLWYEEETRDRVINTYYKIKDKEEQKG